MVRTSGLPNKSEAQLKLRWLPDKSHLRVHLSRRNTDEVGIGKTEGGIRLALGLACKSKTKSCHLPDKLSLQVC